MENKDLPQGWINTTILDCCLLNNKEKINDEVEVAFIPMANVGTGYFDEAIFENKLWKEVKKGYTQFQDKDVLVAKITPCFENGKAALVDNLPNGFGAGSTEYFVLRAKNNILPSFLYSLIKDRQFLIQGEINMTGSVGHRRVPKEFIENYPIRLPPLAEQKEIVRVVESHLKLVDQIKSRLDALPKILEQFRQSVLASAVSGKLTNIVNEAPIASLEEYVEIENGARVPISSFERKKNQGNIPYFGATGIVDYVEGYTHDGRYLLVGEDGANLLSKAKDLSFIVEGKIWVNNHAHVLKEKTGVSLDFIKIVINSLDLSKWVTGSAQPKLTQKSLRLLPIPAFSFKEQLEIVKRVESLFALADQIEAKIKNAQERVNLLTQSILAKAFRGELTAKWREENPDLISGDNSAEALLKRIEAEKKKSKKK